jgi:hypothetical protein
VGKKQIKAKGNLIGKSPTQRPLIFRGGVVRASILSGKGVDELLSDIVTVEDLDMDNRPTNDIE